MLNVELHQIQKIQEDSYDLIQRIADLEKKSNRIIKDNKRSKTNPKGIKLFQTEKKFLDIHSRIEKDVSTLKNKIQEKKEDLDKKKISLELKECTFKPHINENTAKMLKDTYVPVYKKELIKKENVKIENSNPPKNIEKNHLQETKKKKNFTPKFDDKMTSKKLVSKLEKMYYLKKLD
jgi:hypothetical protein